MRKNNVIIEESIVLNLLKSAGKSYLSIKAKAGFLYAGCFTHLCCLRISSAIKNLIKYSVFGRKTAEGKAAEADKDYFQTSGAVKIMLNMRKGLRNKIENSYIASGFLLSLKNTQYAFSLRPLQLGGAVLVLAISINSALSVILHKQLSLWGWCARIIFLSAGIGCLFSGGGWKEIKESSLAMRWINNGCKIKNLD